MPAANKPTKITIRSYQVGFGDCYLLTFHYANRDRHVLIDFGTKFRSKVGFKVDMKAIAKRISADCGGTLTMVVATHRHCDHISGFATNAKGDGPGDIIRACKPALVVQPWTEDPKLPKDATGPVAAARGHVKALAEMNAFAEAVIRDLPKFADGKFGATKAAALELQYLGGDNITNRSAVENLMTMVKPAKRKYLHLGSKLAVSTLLPGVKIHVLGPPTLEQSDKIRAYAKHSDDYWKLQAMAAAPPKRNGQSGAPFNGGHKAVPQPAQWFARQLREMRADSALEIVRSLDKVMNNTSLILLFEVDSKRLLFPGDAQLENWSVALRDKKVRKLLAGVDLYKVGHHGSHNATPQHLLWEGFSKRGKASFTTLLSTHAGEYSGVPRRSLSDALKRDSTLLSTAEFGQPELSRSVTIAL